MGLPQGEQRRRASSNAKPLSGYAHPEVQPSTLTLDKDDERLAFLKRCVAPHVDSFNFAIGPGLMQIAELLEPVIVRGPVTKDGVSTLIALRVHSLSVKKPTVSTSTAGQKKAGITMNLYPSQCRKTGANYQGDLLAAFTVILDNDESFEVPIQRIARVPIMVGSNRCHLSGKSRAELVALGEEEFEAGGTFIVNGGEKVMRLVVVPRANHAISAKREKNAARGPLFSDLSLSYRSMRRDLSTFTLHFHLLRSGAVRLRLTINRSEYFIPVGLVMRALLPSGTSDREIYQLIVGGDSEDKPLCSTAIAIIKELSERAVSFRQKDAEPSVNSSVSRTAATAFLGRTFKAVIGLDDPSISNEQAGVAFLRRYILVHLSVGTYERADEALDHSKADLIVLLVRKLASTATGDVEVDDADALSHQALMPPGQLYLAFLKEKIEVMMRVIAAYVRREAAKDKLGNRTTGAALRSLITEGFTKALNGDQVSRNMSYLIATGNLKTDTGLDLPQAVGYSVMAERINFLRFISHFRAVHRGAFYAAMRSTKVRKLLPEAWGFICPVHTPDGDPCGILNHLASEAFVTHGYPIGNTDALHLFSDYNLTPAPALSRIDNASPKGSLPVVVDGRVIGFVQAEAAQRLADQIRYTKVRENVPVIPKTTEVAYIPPTRGKSGFSPGIYVHSCAGRVMRPVKWLRAPKRKAGIADMSYALDEMIGSLEQVFLRVRPAVEQPESGLNPIDTEGASHSEISNVAFLSELAALSPFPDMNQGPRNMFQCQMAKQTMGTPCHTVWSRTDSKVYRHTTPQVPITRNFSMQDPMGADLFPNGVNAVVAVISYTGNDMEDALIINKSSLERGFAHGTVYVNEKVDLDDSIAGRETKFVPLSDEDTETARTLDNDGLPAVGERLRKGDKLYGVCGRHSAGGLDGEVQWKRYKSVEDGTVDEVMIMDSDMYRNKRRPHGNGVRQALIRTRVSRPPSVGDKFASRAGQKGTMSAAWPSEDMPFSESGMMPDILFNPNGFPSRMTIGMMVEIMSGKAGALHGHFNDSTPFQFDETHRAVDFFAEQLRQAGFSPCGNETLYSGYTGEPFQVEIFTGIVHYQRLRHMVSDKFQVRTTGAIHPLFRQPIKGRKRGGAIRFGEMERDGLLAHGASFLLRDRLAMASDMHVLHVCDTCGSILGPCRRNGDSGEIQEIYCRMCTGEREHRVQRVAIPYSFKYLANELAAMNIRTVLKLREVA